MWLSLLSSALWCMAGCNIGDDYNKSAQGCTSNEECMPGQICAIDGRCVDLPTPVEDMTKGASDTLSDALDLDLPDMTLVDLAEPVEDMPPDLPPDMMRSPDMSPDMSSSSLPPAFTRLDLAREPFEFAAAAVASSKELLMVGMVGDTEAALLYLEPDTTPVGFKMSVPGQSFTRFTDVTTTPDGDALVIGQYSSGGAGAGLPTSFSMLIASSGQKVGDRTYNAADPNLTLQAVTTVNSRWITSGVIGKDKESFFVARHTEDARVARARQITPTPKLTTIYQADVIALHGYQDHAYVITHLIESGTRKHTLISRHRDTSLEPDWVKQINDVLLYDLTVVDRTDEVYLTGEVRDSNDGYLLSLEADTGNLVEAYNFPNHLGRVVYWDEEDEESLWLVTTSNSARAETALYRLDVPSFFSTDELSTRGIALSGLTSMESPTPLVGWNGWPTLVGQNSIDRTLDIYPLNKTPRAACGNDELGVTVTLLLTPAPVLLEDASYNHTDLQIEGEADMFGTQSITPTATSPICR